MLSRHARKVIQATLWILCTCAPALAQPADVAIRARLDVRLHWIHIEYGEPYIDGEGVLLRGEPIDLELRVSNLDRTGPEVTAVEADWHRRISIRIRTGGREGKDQFRTVACTFLPNASSGAKVVRRAGMLLLPYGARAVEMCRVVLQPSDLAAGAHTLEVDWSDAADMARFRKVIPQELPRPLQFEYRDIATGADQRDLSIHLARRAIDDGRVDEAATHVERLLRIEPMATSGLILRGLTKLAKGDCRAASQDWTLAANVLENDSDVLNRGRADRMRMDPDAARRTARNLRAQLERRGCK